jgi:uncharacterized protein YozE (UPF0346 family)
MAFGKIKVDEIQSSTQTLNVDDLSTSASPTFTGTVTIPTPTAGDNSTKAASTAFVDTSFAKKASPTFTGTPTLPTGTIATTQSAGNNTTAIATTAFVDTSFAKKASPTFTGTVTTAGITIDGAYKQTAEAVAALAIDCATGNYFTKTINANSTFTVSNVPASGTAYAFILELTHTSGTITWFSGVEWPSSTAPTLTTGKTHLFIFQTDNAGTRWRASSLVDYTN